MESDGGSCAGDEIVLAFDDHAYPGALRHVHAPPSRLYVRGRLSACPEELSSPAIAIVGARDATAYGLAFARSLARELAQAGLCVVSGLALGIDGAAHRGALDAGGTTIAVLGTGTDILYPRAHRALRDEILARGAVVSELPPGTPPRREHFPQRNRIISGLALGVVVVEATLKSGSLVTAQHALEQGREVFAVPGPVTSARSRGPHALLKRGARLVESVDDVLLELPPGVLRPRTAGGAATGLSPELAELLTAIRDGASTVDAMAARTDTRIPEILNQLLLLELRGLVVRGPGGLYVATADAAASGTARAEGGVDSPPDER
ncbi:MAG TPA: DNA-processing protein DprA [Candidatus Binatia bacterium]